MNLTTLKKCLRLCKNKYETEYSGNVSLENVKQISNTKVNRISIGSLTHSAKTFDFTLVLS
jgi:nicotinate-nucleotide pyrophosphorylase (carboxylating)